MAQPSDIATDLAQRVTARIGNGWSYRFIPAEDASVDDEIRFVMPDGRLSTIDLQIGLYGIVPAKAYYESGELTGVRHYDSLEVDPRDLEASVQPVAELLRNAEAVPEGAHA
mgnify:CR=1 FL=1